MPQRTPRKTEKKKKRGETREREEDERQFVWERALKVLFLYEYEVYVTRPLSPLPSITPTTGELNCHHHDIIARIGALIATWMTPFSTSIHPFSAARAVDFKTENKSREQRTTVVFARRSDLGAGIR
jgi:hypothetical protein